MPIWQNSGIQRFDPKKPAERQAFSVLALKSGGQGIRGRPSCFSALHLYQDALKGADFDGLGEVGGHARVKEMENFYKENL